TNAVPSRTVLATTPPGTAGTPGGPSASPPGMKSSPSASSSGTGSDAVPSGATWTATGPDASDVDRHQKSDPAPEPAEPAPEHSSWATQMRFRASISRVADSPVSVSSTASVGSLPDSISSHGWSPPRGDQHMAARRGIGPCGPDVSGDLPGSRVHQQTPLLGVVVPGVLECQEAGHPGREPFGRGDRDVVRAEIVGVDGPALLAGPRVH